MSSVVISGDTSGTVSVTVPAVAGTNTVTIPAVTGTAVIGSSAVSAAGQIPFSTDGSTYTPTAKIVIGTPLASTSGTSFDFTSIPSWVKRVTVNWAATSHNGSSPMMIQIGSSAGLVTSAYTGNSTIFGSSTVTSLMSTGFLLTPSIGSASLFTGTATFSLIIPSTNTWNMIGIGAYTDASYNTVSAGYRGLAGALDRIRFTTVNGTDTFDSGSINILYE